MRVCPLLIAVVPIPCSEPIVSLSPMVKVALADLSVTVPVSNRAAPPWTIRLPLWIVVFPK